MRSRWPFRLSKSRVRRGLVLVSVVVLLGGCIEYVAVQSNRSTAPSEIPLSALAQGIKRDDITQIRIGEGDGLATTRSGETVHFTTQPGESVLKVLANLGATPDALSRTTYSVADPPPFWFGALSGLLPLVVFVGLGLFVRRRLGTRAGNPMQSFGQTQARVADAARPGITFLDVAGACSGWQRSC